MSPGSPRTAVLALALVACGAPSGGPEATGTAAEALQQCAPADIEGVDVYDGTGTVDWVAAKGAGVDFAIMKATQGTYNTQSTFPANWSGTKAAGIYRSAYHFFDPTEDGVAQANHFLAVASAMGAGDLPAMLDVECPDGDANCLYMGGSGQAAPALIKTRIMDWLTTVEAATGKKPLVYTFPSYFSSNGIDATGLEAYPLYIADIVSGSCTTVPAPWTSAVFWQYSWTSTVAGISNQVDKDRFMGTLAGLGMLGQGGGGDAGVGADAGADTGADASADASADVDGGRVGVDTAAPGPGGSSGCGCNAAGPGPSRSGLALLLAGLALVWRRRHGRSSVLPGAPRTTCRRLTSARA